MKSRLFILVCGLFGLLGGCEQPEKSDDAALFCQRHYQAESYKTAFEECQRAAAEGSHIGFWLLGNIYEYGLGEHDADPEAAFAQYKKAADAGFTPAQTKAGDMALYGIGTEENYEAAWNWLSQAANKGSVEAEFSLGLIFLEGRGRSQDLGLAVRWLREAAEQQHPMSLNHLAWLYATSPQKPWFSPPQARRWYNQLLALKIDSAMFVDTGAAVAASEGDFDLAVSLQKRAISLLPEDTDSDTLNGYQSRLDSYLSGQRWIEDMKQSELHSSVSHASQTD